MIIKFKYCDLGLFYQLIMREVIKKGLKLEHINMIRVFPFVWVGKENEKYHESGKLLVLSKVSLQYTKTITLYMTYIVYETFKKKTR